MDVCDVRDLSDMLFKVVPDVFRRQAFGRALQQNVTGLTGDPDTGDEHEQGHQNGENRIRRDPARGEDDNRRRDGRDRAEQVSDNMPQRALQVQVMLVTAMQYPGGEHVDDQAADGDPQHDAAENRGRVQQAVDRFPDNPAGEGDERDAVREGGEHFHAPEPIRTAWVCGALRQLVTHPSQDERCCIGQHVCGIGQQGQGTGNETAGNFRHHERGGQDSCDSNSPARILGRHVCMVMGVPMPVLMIMPMIVGFIW